MKQRYMDNWVAFNKEVAPYEVSQISSPFGDLTKIALIPTTHCHYDTFCFNTIEMRDFWIDRAREQYGLLCYASDEAAYFQAIYAWRGGWGNVDSRNRILPGWREELKKRRWKYGGGGVSKKSGQFNYWREE